MINIPTVPHSMCSLPLLASLPPVESEIKNCTKPHTKSTKAIANSKSIAGLISTLVRLLTSWSIVIDLSLRDLRYSHRHGARDTQGVLEQADKPPDRHHHKQTQEAGDHNISS